MLYAYASFIGSGQRDLITTEEGVLDFVQRYGIRAIAVEEKGLGLDKLGPARLLRYVLRDEEQFRLVATCRITAQAENTSLHNTNLLVYEVRAPLTDPVAEDLTIPLVGLRRAITVPLDGRGKPRIAFLPWKKKRK